MRKVQIEYRRPPGEWSLKDANEQFARLQDSMEWSKTYGRPFDAMALIARSLLTTWEVCQKKPTAKRKKQIDALIEDLIAGWKEMCGLPMVQRSLENRGVLAITAWAIRMLAEANGYEFEIVTQSLDP